MKTIKFSELNDNPRQQLTGTRWLILHHSEIQQATSILMFTELDGILVAVDHRGSEIEDGLWQRAVHLMIVDTNPQHAEDFQRKSGITKVVHDPENDILLHCW